MGEVSVQWGTDRYGETKNTSNLKKPWRAAISSCQKPDDGHHMEASIYCLLKKIPGQIGYRNSRHNFKAKKDLKKWIKIN